MYLDKFQNSFSDTARSMNPTLLTKLAPLSFQTEEEGTPTPLECRIPAHAQSTPRYAQSAAYCGTGPHG